MDDYENICYGCNLNFLNYQWGRVFFHVTGHSGFCFCEIPVCILWILWVLIKFFPNYNFKIVRKSEITSNPTTHWLMLWMFSCMFLIAFEFTSLFYTVKVRRNCEEGLGDKIFHWVVYNPFQIKYQGLESFRVWKIQNTVTQDLWHWK